MGIDALVAAAPGDVLVGPDQEQLGPEQLAQVGPSAVTLPSSPRVAGVAPHGW
jgi:hypothetical protein